MLMRCMLLFRPSVVFFAASLVVALTMLALASGPSSGKVNCEPEEPNSLEKNCTGGAGTGSGGGGGRTVFEENPDGGGTLTISGGEGEGINEVTEPHNTGGHGSITYDSEGVVSGTYSGASPFRGTKGGGHCTYSGSEEPECVGSGGFQAPTF